MKSGSHREPRVSQAVDGASPSPATLDELRERIERLEEVIRVNMMARVQDPGLDETALNRAIRELARGNRKPLDCFDASHVGQTDLGNIENNFACLKSSFSGTSAPSNPVAGMVWYDTTNNLEKLRNAANNAWLEIYD